MKALFPFIFLLAVSCSAFLILTAAACGRLCQLADVPAPSAVTVVLDAGHGGEDGGASGKSGLLEKDINLAIAKDMREILTVAGYRVAMTRTDDRDLSDSLRTIRERKVSDIHNRMKFVESQGSCILISIHQNHFEQSRYHGTQVFYSGNDPKSKELAEAVRGKVVGLLQNDNNRETKPATSSIYLLWHAKVPAILVECGFLSNGEEEAKLSSDQYQRQIAFSICCGLEDYSGAK